MVKSRHPLADDVLDLTERIAAAAASCGAQQDAALLRQDARAAAVPGSVVVVVGEQKRGKSSLVNALVGRHRLLPVDVDVATSVHLCVSYGEQDEAWALGAEPRRITFGELAEYAAVDPGTGVEGHPEVTGVEVRLPADVLAGGTELVDTPGVGGLLAGHASLTLAALQRADALLFVVNGSHELTRSELQFLQQATERTRTVLFALTAVDRDPGWRAGLERNRELLRTHAPQFLDAPWFPVSSKFKSDADRLAPADADFAAQLHERSGFAPLLAELRDNIGRRAHGQQLHELLTGGVETLTQLADRLAETERSLDQDGGLAEQMRRREQELTALQDADAAWRGRLAERVGAVDRRLRQQAEAGLVALSDTARAAVAAGGRDMSTEVPRNLADGLRGLGLQLENTLYEEMGDVLDDLSAEFGVSGVRITPAQLGLADTAPADPPRAPDAPVVVAPPEPGRIEPLPWQLAPADRTPALTGGEPRRTGVLDRVPQEAGTLVSGVGGAIGRGARGFGGLAKGGKAAVLAGAAAVVIGGLYGGVRLLRGRRREEVLAHIDRMTEKHRATLPPALQAALWQVHADLERSAGARLADRQLRLRQDIADAEANRAAARAELAPRLDETRRRLGEVTDALAEAEDLRRKLRS